MLSPNWIPGFLFSLCAFGIIGADAATITIDGTVTPVTVVTGDLYQTDDLVLENGASLVVESNAVINSVYTDLATPGSIVTMNPGSAVGQISGQGASVIVNGGSCPNFGLSQSRITIYGMDPMPDGSPAYLFLGAFVDGDAITINGGNYVGVAAYLQNSDVTINGGNFGSAGGIAMINAPQGTNQMVINDGTFPGVEIVSYGPLFIHGGNFESAINFSDTLYIDGGTFGGATAGSGVLYPIDASYIGAGYVPAVYIAGGNFNGANSGYFDNEAYAYNWNVVVHGSGLDESSYDSAAGGTLGVTFCSGATSTIGFVNSSFGQPPVITQDPCSVDSDGDGVLDNVDHCIFSDLSPTVMIGNRDSGVANTINGSLVNTDGCSLADLIHAELVNAATGAKNHGQYVKTMAAYFNGLLGDGVIDSLDKGALMSCVASSDESQFVQ